MGILDSIVGWIAEQVMHVLDLITTSVLGALGCDMSVFMRYFPAAETMYHIFVAMAIGMILLNWIWQLFKNFGLGVGIEAEDPVKLSIKSVLFIILAYFSDQIVATVLKIGGTPYVWIMTADLPPLSFANFSSVMLVILGRRRNHNCADISPYTCMELHKAAIRGCREIYTSRRSCFYGSDGVQHGRGSGNVKYFQVMGSYAWRTGIFTHNERLVFTSFCVDDRQFFIQSVVVIKKERFQ